MPASRAEQPTASISPHLRERGLEPRLTVLFRAALEREVRHIRTDRRDPTRSEPPALLFDCIDKQVRGE